MRLRDVEVPDRYYNRIRTSSPELDELFGGLDYPGVMPGSMGLLTGVPGIGKSTLCLQLADMLMRTSRLPVLYNCGEETVEMVRLRAKRLGIIGDFAIATFEEVDELIAHVVAAGVGIVFQDSLQTLHAGSLDGSHLLKVAVKKLVELSKVDGTTVFLIGHATKGGDFAGPAKIKHDADFHMHLSFDKKTGERVVQLQKNRFGPAMQPYSFTLGGAGVAFGPAEPSQRQAVGKAGPGPEDPVLGIVRRLLLAGRKLSGYSHEEEPEIEAIGITGGAMRHTLRLACRDLEREGHEVVRCTINRREHSFLRLPSVPTDDDKEDDDGTWDDA